jgi:hypothetical protein
VLCAAVTPHYCSREQTSSISSGWRQFCPDKKKMIAPVIDRMNPAGRNVALVPVWKQAANESADDRTTDAAQSRHDETEMW